MASLCSSLVVILVWVYYSTQILFFGAEFTKIFALHRGRRITPDPRAMKMTKPQPVEEQPQGQGKARTRS